MEGNSFHWKTALVIIGLIGGPLAVWGESQLERGRTKEKLEQVEKRQEQDRRDTRESLGEVNSHIKEIDQNVQIILQKITGMEAVQRAEKRERRE